MGCGTSMPVHPEGGAETDALQALAQQIAALRSDNVALQQQLTSTRSEVADDKQTIVALKGQLTALTSTRSDNVALQQQLTSTRSELADAQQTIVALQEQVTRTRSELADAVTREQFATATIALLQEQLEVFILFIILAHPHILACLSDCSGISLSLLLWVCGYGGMLVW
jgi:predicted  nucleic acid-binding Zn-ribbon protein